MRFDSEERLYRMRVLTSSMLVGALAWIGTYGMANSHSDKEKPGALHALSCQSLGTIMRKELNPGAPVPITIETLYNKAGSISLRFLEAQDGQLYIDFGDRENLRVSKDELAAHPDGTTQTIHVRENRYASLQLFLDATNNQTTMIEATCLNEAQFAETTPTAGAPLVPHIVAEVPSK